MEQVKTEIKAKTAKVSNLYFKNQFSIFIHYLLIILSRK
jgi:hypothetical protein